MEVVMNLSQKQSNLPDRVQQWNLYHRLQELGIPCGNSPFSIDIPDIPTVGTAIQIWCATRAVVSPKQEHISFLEQCWRLKHES